MTDYESHHELDDELLSAYLDDELSPEERASVDMRLLEDPAAQQLLHQLRAVSQSVQALPQEVVGHDLGEAVLRKVEQSRHTSATAAAATEISNRDTTSGTPTQLDNSVPTFTIGRSRRGWVWASLAVAAALLIMAFQADRNINMPAVALRKDPQAGEESTRRMSRSGELELRNLGEPAAPPAETDVIELRAAAPGATAGTTLNVNESVNGPMPASGVPPADGLATDGGIPPASEPSAPESAPADALAVDSRAYSEEAMQAGRRSVTAGGEVADADSPLDALSEARPDVALQRERSETVREVPDESATASNSEQLVVVRVLARRDALRTKTFDQLLATNGIEVAAEEAKDDSTPSGASSPQSRFAVEDELNRNVELRDQQPQEGGVEEDLVLVEAPRSVIASCLEGLSRDAENYLGLEVGDAPVNVTARGIETSAAAGNSPTVEAALAKKLGEVSDWTRYNRGTVPPPQQSIARDKAANLNYRFYVQNDNDAGRGGFRGGYGVAGGLEQLKQENESLARERSGGAGQGQARRLRLWGTEARQSGQRLDFGGIAPEEQAATDLSIRMREAQRELKSAAEPATDTLQVLFVLSPSEEPAPSLKARNKAQ